jgi:hypothetical protein
MSIIEEVFKNYSIQIWHMPSWLTLLLLVSLATAQLQLCTGGSSTNCLPCGRQCSACSNQTACSTCSNEYYLASASAGTCTGCPSNCLQCSSNTVCSTCSAPYVLASGSCSLCTVLNAQSCSSVTTASSCKSGYYLSSGSCSSCLLNCASCGSSTDCTACGSGYYLNSSILTCNPCPQGCTACDQYTPTSCTSCSSGYQLSGTACSQVSCSLANCLYCASSTVCQRCKAYYYWDGSQCLAGSSITCELGATGPLPNNCRNGCSDYAYISGNSSGTFQCKPYSSIYLYPVEYQQLYYYAFNHLASLNALASASLSLSTASNG